MAPLASRPSRRRLSPPSTAPSVRCNISPSSPPQKRISGNSWDPLSGWNEGVKLSNPSGGPATLSSAQKGEQVQHPAPPPKDRTPDPTIADIPTGGQGTKGNCGLPPSLLDILPDNGRNSTSTTNPPSPQEGHGLKFPPFLEPGKGKTNTSDSPPSPTTPAPPPSGPTNPPFAPPFTIGQPPKLEATPAPSPPATSAKSDGKTPPPAQTSSVQTTTTTSDRGAVTVSPTVTRSAPVIEGELRASFPTREASSSVLPATSSSRTTKTNTIKSDFVFVTTALDSTSRTEDVARPTESSHIDSSTPVEPLITSPTTFTTFSVVTTPGQVSSTPLIVTSVAALPTTISQSPNGPTTAGATSSNSRASAVISGAVVGAAIVLLAFSLLVLYLVRRRRRRQASFRNANTRAYPTSGAAAFSPLSDSETPGPMREVSAVRGTLRPFYNVSPMDNSISPRTMIPRTAQESSLLLSAATFGSDSSHHSPRHTPNASDTSIHSTHEIPSASHPYWGPVLQQARETLVSGSSVGQGSTGTIGSSADPYSLDSEASPSSRPVTVSQTLAALDPFADLEPNPFDDPTVPTKYLTFRPGTRSSLASGRVSPSSMLVHE